MFRAYAKINLGLRVLERRPDGYHEIETVFHRVALYDEIAFTPSPTIRVVSSSHEVPEDETNLCHRAATLLADVLQPDGGVCIELHKRIPVAAGLGGGSSDAATVLMELPRFWNREATPDLIRTIALRIGSDVPFFLGKGSALGTGRGEELDYFFPDIPYWVLLCTPNISISTSWAYAHVKPTAPAHSQILKQTLLDCMHSPERLAEALVNDFEPIVFPAYPVVREVKESMLLGGAVFASMSGSGSSVYGFFRNDEEATGAGQSLTAQGFSTWLTPPHFLV